MNHLADETFEDADSDVSSNSSDTSEHHQEQLQDLDDDDALLRSVQLTGVHERPIPFPNDQETIACPSNPELDSAEINLSYDIDSIEIFDTVEAVRGSVRHGSVVLYGEPKR